MSNIKLIILAVIAVATTTIAVFLSTAEKSPVTDPTKPKFLIGNIEPSIIGSIVIGTGEDEIIINRSGKKFVVANKDNYPADIAEINDLIKAAVDIQVTEMYTDNPANHKDLGVDVESASVIVKFLKSGGTEKDKQEVLTGFILGKPRQSGRGTFIRQVGKDEVFVTLQAPRVRTGPLDYINQEIAPAISKESIESVEVTQGAEIYTLKQNDEGKIVPEPTKEGMVLKEAEAENVFTALSSLRFTDVMKDPLNLNPNKRYLCRLADKTVYNLFMVEKDGKTYVSCRALYKGELPPASREFSTQEELKEKEAKYLARDKAVEFTNKHTGWVYQISDASAEKLTKPLQDLFEEPEVPEETADPNSVK